MSGTHGALLLIELASARVCDALLGPVTLLDHAISSRPEIGPAAIGAAASLSSRLKLQRAAWSSSGKTLPLSEVAALAEGLPDHVEVDFSALPATTIFPGFSGRIVLNLLLLAADSLPTEGTVILAGSADDLFIRITGPEAAWPTGTALCLANEAEAQSALTDGRNVQMALTALLAHVAGIRLSALFAPTAQAEPAILRLGG
jgi:hypothetical protein